MKHCAILSKNYMIPSYYSQVIQQTKVCHPNTSKKNYISLGSSDHDRLIVGSDSAKIPSTTSTSHTQHQVLFVQISWYTSTLTNTLKHSYWHIMVNRNPPLNKYKCIDWFDCTTYLERYDRSVQFYFTAIFK